MGGCGAGAVGGAGILGGGAGPVGTFGGAVPFGARDGKLGEPGVFGSGEGACGAPGVFGAGFGIFGAGPGTVGGVCASINNGKRINTIRSLIENCTSHPQTISRTLSSRIVPAIFFRFGSPLTSDSSKCPACFIVTLGGIGGSQPVRNAR
jgi:hypothetical protein